MPIASMDDRSLRRSRRSALPHWANNPRITAYHAGTNIEGYDDKVSRCSSFRELVAGPGRYCGHGVRTGTVLAGMGRL